MIIEKLPPKILNTPTVTFKNEKCKDIDPTKWEHFCILYREEYGMMPSESMTINDVNRWIIQNQIDKDNSIFD